MPISRLSSIEHAELQSKVPLDVENGNLAARMTSEVKR